MSIRASGSLIALVLFVLVASPCLAQLNRSFVSVSGSDANACTAAAPCRSFGAAMAQTNPEGEILATDSGGYGTFTIDRSVRVVAAPGVYAAVTSTAGNAITVAAGAFDQVSLRGLVLSSLGGQDGIQVDTVGRLFVDHVTADGFSQAVDIVTAGDFFLTDFSARNSNLGVRGLPATGVANVFIVDSYSALSSGTGFFAGEGTRMNLFRSVAVRGGVGAFASSNNSSRPANLVIEFSLITGNLFGIETFGAAAVARVSNSTISHNETAATSGNGSSVLSRQNNTVQGNTNNGTFTGTFGAN